MSATGSECDWEVRQRKRCRAVKAAMGALLGTITQLRGSSYIQPSHHLATIYFYAIIISQAKKKTKLNLTGVVLMFSNQPLMGKILSAICYRNVNPIKLVDTVIPQVEHIKYIVRSMVQLANVLR